MLELEPAIATTSALRDAAARQADFNFQQNLGALRKTQPEIAGVWSGEVVQWVFARDGSLSALDGSGKWHGGCSVPRRAAEELLRSLEISANVACFLGPAHASQIAIALERLKAHQAVIALLPEFDDLNITLHCHDFSKEIEAHRLWVVAGENWREELSRLLCEKSGLTIPQQFIRTALLSEESAAPLVESAQKIFSQEHQRRTALIAELRSRQNSVVPGRPRVALAAPMRFRLWDDAGGTMARVVAADTACDWTTIDFDDPLSSSPLTLAEAAANSDAVFAANLTRGDCAELVSPGIPIITWLTRPKIPAIAFAGPRDALIVADPRWIDVAKKSGWPAARIGVGRWPGIATSTNPAALTVIADTRTVEEAPSFDLSSHQLLWNLIREEMVGNPLVCGADVLAYLRSRMARLGIADEGFDHRRFIEELIVPAYQQGIVWHLLKSDLPLRIFGEGWMGVSNCAGPISSLVQLATALHDSAALIHLWPIAHAHPIDTAGPPIIGPIDTGLGGLVREARLALAGGLKPPLIAADVLVVPTIARMLAAVLG